MLDHLFDEKRFPDIQSKPLLVQLEIFPSLEESGWNEWQDWSLSCEITFCSDVIYSKNLYSESHGVEWKGNKAMLGKDVKSFMTPVSNWNIVPMEGEVQLEPALGERYGKGKDGKNNSEAEKASPTRKSRMSWSNLVATQDKFRADKMVSSLRELLMPKEL
ncbi:hypothetical protein DUI87_13298 [Hirundo rustica rustica]|uniref:Uncharacterized protein n=1 Tax=Hirundo rustica rustica TaxID=333673 RepID=A0A3M0KBB3_HIRRU|nr:hypothetical protein DUI87_13298 [Hirundo rustica rustica]